MFLRHSKIVLSVSILILFFTACSSPAETGTQEAADAPAAPTATEAQPVESALSPGEVIHISGEGSQMSEPFALEGPGTIEAFWRQECNVFYLQMVNSVGALADAPMGTIIFESAAAPSEHTPADAWELKFEYVPGQYVFDITCEEGTWEVWAVVEYPEGEG